MSDFVSLSAGRPAVAQLAGSAARSPIVPRHRAIRNENTHPVGSLFGRVVAYAEQRAGGNCFHKASSHAKMDASVRHNAAPSSVVWSIAWACSMAFRFISRSVVA